MAKSDLRIDILGTSISISTDEDPEYLNRLLAKYRQTIENVQRISGLKDPLKIAILTGFLLCDDLEKAGVAVSSDRETGEFEQLTLDMISRLDELMPVDADEDTPENPVPESLDTGHKETEEIPAYDSSSGDKIMEPGEYLCESDENNYAAPISAFFKLQNTVKHYDWGSPEWIPALLGQRNLSRIPWAELWMGVHPAGPSRIAGENGALLSELIARNRTAFLGKETAEKYGKLPFLFKVEAAAKPLSIQAHPNREQARQGFDRETREEIPPDAPNRNYPDTNHKPEITCALSPFAALCGFRKTSDIGFLMEIFSQGSEGALKAGLENLISALGQKNENPLKAFLAALFSLTAEAREALGPFIKTHAAVLEGEFPEYKDEWKLCSYLSGFFPEDPGVIAPLFLNIIELAPGQSMYLPAGVLHAYIHGLGIELMADSDNVLRGGLTSKYVDKNELFRILDFSEYTPEILRVPEQEGNSALAPSWFSYPAPSEEFVLSVLQSPGQDPKNPVPWQGMGPSIVIITQGSAALCEPGTHTEIQLKTGESVFIPAEKNLVFSGTFTAYAASTGPLTAAL